MSLTPVTITGTFKTPTGTAASGSVRFSLVSPIIDAVGNVIVGQHVVEDTLDGTGSISVVIYATSGGGVTPANNAYRVEEMLTGCPRRVYEIAVPDSPTTADISDYVPVSARPAYEFEGTPGADGSTVLSGAGAPASLTGDDGDFYINVTAWTIYGPKTAGAWGSPTSLIGPTGDTGATGPTGPISSVNGDTGPAVVLTAADVGADASGSAAAAQAAAVQRANHTGTQAISTVSGLQSALDAKQETSEKGAANGYASLDSGGKVPSAQLPLIAITDTFVVASEAAMLALTAEVGDVAIRSDESKTYILQTAPASTLANWKELLFPTGSGVDSVNGLVGVVVLDPDDLDDTSTTNKFATAAELTKLAGIETGADVTDAANVEAAGALMKTGGGKETYHNHGAAGATETVDLSLGNIHRVVLDANCTLTFSGATASVGCSFTLILVQDATGSRTVTWPSSVDWASATAPTLSTAANAVDVLTFVTVDGGTTWLGFLAGKGMA